MYQINIDPDSLEFSILKDEQALPFEDCHNIKWALQTALAVINRTESEVKRRKSIKK